MMDDLWLTLMNSLTYEGHWLHAWLNAMLIVLTVLPFLRAPRPPGWRPHQGWKLCLGIITLLQVALWFLADAVGVSLIWCAMAGFLAGESWRGGFTQNRLAQAALLAALAAIVYYAIAFPLITTVAHLVAVLVGVTFFLRLPQGRAER
ncbi:MAG: hypothetical protein KF832_24020 [Caldilineaceae bacterium]|nr:hypothetical protein [Caldilineaceae bacterium]